MYMEKYIGIFLKNIENFKTLYENFKSKIYNQCIL